MENSETSTFSRIAMTLISVIAGLLLCAAVGAQYLKGKAAELESAARYTAPVQIEVTGFEALPVQVYSTSSSQTNQFSPALTYKLSDSDSKQTGQITLSFEELSYETEKEALEIAQGHYQVGQKLGAYAIPGDVSKVSLEKSSQTNTASVLNTVTAILVALALVLLWIRRQFKHETLGKTIAIRGCIALPFLGIGLLLASAAWQGISTNSSIDTWVQTQAVIHSVDVETSTSGNGRSRSTSYTPRVSYSFEVEGKPVRGNHLHAGIGHSYHSQAEADAILKPYQIGQKVVVYYNPEQPGQNALIKQESGWGGILFFALGALAMFSICGFSFLTISSPKR